MDELVIAAILSPEVIEEVRYRVVLVVGAREVCREAASGDTRGDLGVFVRCAALCAADTCHIGACKIIAG
jgi:hypothetical protein